MSTGGGLATKGVVYGGGALSSKGAAVGLTGTAPSPVPIPVPVVRGQGEPFSLSQEQTPTMIVVPSAHNIALLAAENITANLRVQQPANLVLPSLYKRAFLIAYETDEIAVVRR